MRLKNAVVAPEAVIEKLPLEPSTCIPVVLKVVSDLPTSKLPLLSNLPLSWTVAVASAVPFATRWNVTSPLYRFICEALLFVMYLKVASEAK